MSNTCCICRVIKEDILSIIGRRLKKTDVVDNKLQSKYSASSFRRFGRNVIPSEVVYICKDCDLKLEYCENFKELISQEVINSIADIAYMSHRIVEGYYPANSERIIIKDDVVMNYCRVKFPLVYSQKYKILLEVVGFYCEGYNAYNHIAERINSLELGNISFDEYYRKYIEPSYNYYIKNLLSSEIKSLYEEYVYFSVGDECGSLMKRIADVCFVSYMIAEENREQFCKINCAVPYIMSRLIPVYLDDIVSNNSNLLKCLVYRFTGFGVAKVFIRQIIKNEDVYTDMKDYFNKELVGMYNYFINNYVKPVEYYEPIMPQEILDIIEFHPDLRQDIGNTAWNRIENSATSINPILEDAEDFRPKTDNMNLF